MTYGNDSSPIGPPDVRRRPEMIMRPRRVSAGILLLSSIVLAACGTQAPPAQGASSAREDDFSSGACFPGRLEVGATKGYECVDDEFRAWIDNDQEAYDFVTAPLGESYDDVRIEVDVRFESGDDAGAYIVCRGSQLAGDYYYFRLGVDGSAEISDVLEGEEQIARMIALPEGAIGRDWNRLRADCIGDTLSFYLNGELVLERQEESPYDSGDVGLGAGGGSGGFSAVRFDNLEVRKP